MPAFRKIFIPLFLVIATTGACLSEFGIAKQTLPTLAPTVMPIFTNTIRLASETNTPTFTALSPTKTQTPVFIPSSNPIRKSFLTEDGRQLVGYFYPSWQPNAPVVVFMHQFESNQAAWQESPIIKWLQNWPVPLNSGSPTPSANGLLPIMPPDLSFAVFTFDFRGHGESLPDDIIQDGYKEHAEEFLMDASAAYQTARQLPGVDQNKVIGLGTSIGADAVVDVCEEGCIGAFSVSPGSWLELEYSQAVRKLVAAGKPVRCMYAINDPPSPNTCLSIPPDDHYKIFGYPGKKHGMTFVILPRKMEADFGTNLLEFLLTFTKVG